MKTNDLVVIYGCLILATLNSQTHPYLSVMYLVGAIISLISGTVSALYKHNTRKQQQISEEIDRLHK